MAPKVVFTAASVLCLLCGGYPVAQNWPRNISVPVGSPITLLCNQTSETGAAFVEWRQLKNNQQNDIYRHQNIEKEFADRFSIQKFPLGNCSLVISAVKPDDAAVYKCLCGMKCEYHLVVDDQDQSTPSPSQKSDISALSISNSAVGILALILLGILLFWMRRFCRRCQYIKVRSEELVCATPSPPDVPPTPRTMREYQTFVAAFRGRHGELQTKLNIYTGLLTKLLDIGVVTRHQTLEIEHPMKTDSEKVECLLSTLEQRPPEDLPKFCQALVDTNQSHIQQYHMNHL